MQHCSWRFFLNGVNHHTYKLIWDLIQDSPAIVVDKFAQLFFLTRVLVQRLFVFYICFTGSRNLVTIANGKLLNLVCHFGQLPWSLLMRWIQRHTSLKYSRTKEVWSTHLPLKPDCMLKKKQVRTSICRVVTFPDVLWTVIVLTFYFWWPLVLSNFTFFSV